MMNDHAWMQLHAHRENEHRARARRRGGDDVPAGTSRPAPPHRLRVRPSRHTASGSRTTAALAWVRLASGAGTLDPAAPSTNTLERDAA